MKRDKDEWGDMPVLVDSPRAPRQPHVPLEPWPAQEVDVPVCLDPLVNPPRPPVTDSSTEQSVRSKDVEKIAQGPWDNDIMKTITLWGTSLVRCMKAASTIFMMNKFKIGSDNCDSAQIVGNAGLMADICEAHFRSVPNKPLNEVMKPQPEWKTKGYVEDIRNLWNPNVDYFLRALRNPHILIKSKPRMSIAGGDNTYFAAWTDSTGCLGSNYTIADSIRCIAEAEGH